MTHNFLKEVARVFVDREGNIAYSALPECQEILHSAIKRRERGFRIGTAKLVEQFLDTHGSYSDEQLLGVITGDFKPSELIAWCVSCRENVTFKAVVQQSNSGRRLATGSCPLCGNKVNRILGKITE